MRRAFREEDKVRILLWCDRHCCLCGKSCGTNIEIAHIDAKGPREIDNAIPLCFECHTNTGHYNREHPRGNKYRADELKSRREQVYEQHTRLLVPPIHYEITQEVHGGGKRPFPDVSFNITHMGDSLPVQCVVRIRPFLGGRDLGQIGGDLYSGRSRWNLNPRFGIAGHFEVPREAVESNDRLELQVSVSVIDQYERQHDLLPVSWVYMPSKSAWFAHPSPGRF